MTTPRSTLTRSTWAADRRLDYIHWRVHEAGLMLRRGDLMAAFGVSEPQASADIAAYERAHSGALRYDKSAKGYLAGAVRPDRCLPSGRAIADLAAAMGWAGATGTAVTPSGAASVRPPPAA